MSRLRRRGWVGRSYLRRRDVHVVLLVHGVVLGDLGMFAVFHLGLGFRTVLAVLRSRLIVVLFPRRHFVLEVVDWVF